MQWNSALYDHKHDYVWRYGEEVIALLAPLAGERILDVGCGTGDLTHALHQLGVRVVGIDYSEEMVASALGKYPHLEVQRQSATDFAFDEPFHAVFSNAALHWVLDKDKAIDCIYRCLRPGGRFAAEFGGKGNIGRIAAALQGALTRHGYAEHANRPVWYFPSLAEYATLLEARGFRVQQAFHFDRPTELQDSDGIRNWIAMFANSYTAGLDTEVVDKVLAEVEAELQPFLFRDGHWYADYVRLRILAVKMEAPQHGSAGNPL